MPLDNEKMIRHITSLLPVMTQEQTIFLEKNIVEGQKLGLFSSNSLQTSKTENGNSNKMVIPIKKRFKYIYY